MSVKKLGAPSRSDVIRRAIGLSDALTDAVGRGDKIIIEGHGQRREIMSYARIWCMEK